jgi:hypothetical protein
MTPAGHSPHIQFDAALPWPRLTPFCRSRLTASRHQNLKVTPAAAACSTHDAAGAAPHIQRWTSVSDAPIIAYFAMRTKVADARRVAKFAGQENPVS